MVAAVGIAVSAGMVPVPAALADPAGPPSDAAPKALTVEQALVQARSSGRPVAVPGSTTTTDALTANPNGTLTLTRSAVPARKFTAGRWIELDPTLRANADGTVTPAATSAGVVLSGGGTGPVVTMTDADAWLALSMPMVLPTPTLTGATATYREVLPGVDLRITADRQGGLNQVLVVHDRDAAANPALTALRLDTRTNGLSVAVDEHGNLTASDKRGRARFAAPAPLMWDSTQPPAGTTTLVDSTGIQRDTGSGRPLTSSVGGPGAAARVAPVKATAVKTTPNDGHVELTPDRPMLTGADTVFPVYIDPNWTPVGQAKDGWTTVTKNFPNTNYWKKSPDPSGRMQVGNAGSIWSHTLINFPIPVATLAGATINSATFYITNVYSYTCSPKTTMYVHAPSATLTSANATWNHWTSNLGGAVAEETFAHGYNASCPAAGVGFNVLSTVQADVNAGKTMQTFALTAKNESTDRNGYKEFDQNSPTLSITYNHTPNQPAGMSTSPATACGAGTPTIVGDGPMTLFAPVSDRNGGTLGVQYNVWKTADAARTPIASSDPNLLTYSSGTTAVFSVSQATLRTAAAGAITQFSWQVRVTDTIATSGWSAVCTFSFDPTRASAPTVTNPATPTTIGQPAAFTITKPPTGTVPSGYLYQLNGGIPNQVNAASGNATITVTPNRSTNVLTVTALSAGSNIGDTATVIFNSAPAAVAIDQDLTGDRVADLYTVGATNGLPAGLWQATGKNNGTVVTTTVNVGVRGNGVTGAHAPSDFTGAQAIAGRFTGTGLQDFLVYYPGGNNPGSGVIIKGNGDGSILQAQLNGNVHNVPAGMLTDINNTNPVQLANAGNSSGQNLAYPDLISINGDSSSGYSLTYYASQNGISNYQFPATLANTTPSGGTDWNAWTITTTQTSSGTAMFLWNRSTGALYLWRNLAFDLGTQTLTYTQHALATNWNTNILLRLQAADVNGDTTPDLWTVGVNGRVTAWLVNLTGTAGAISAQPAQTLNTAAHSWPLADASANPGAPVTNATDTTGQLPLTGTGNAVWHTGDLFDPDVRLNGTTAALTTTGPALATSADFTVSVWARPDATTGTVLSQDGAQTAGFKLFAEPGDASWRFALTRTDAANATTDTAAAPPATVKPGVWTHLTATYHRSSGVANLYINGVHAATTSHTTVWSAGGPFRIGDHRHQNNRSGHFAGQVAHIQTWNQVIDSMQPKAGEVFALYDSTNGPLQTWRFGPTTANAAAMTPTFIAETTGASTTTSTSVTGDFDADGHTDTATFAPSGTKIQISVMHWNGSTANHTLVFTSTTDWALNRSKIVAGDFNGDGKDDLGYVYDLGNTEWNISVLLSSSTVGHMAFQSPAEWYHNPQGNADFSRMKVVAGDFDADGRDDIAHLYNYGNCTSKLWVHRSTGTNLGQGTLAGSASDGGWCWDLSRLMTGNFDGTGPDDIVIFYDYGNAQWSLWTWKATSTGGQPSFTPEQWWSNPAGWSDANRQKLIAGDFNNDGKTDIANLYNYDGCTSKLWFHYSNGTAFSAGHEVWYSTPGSWCWQRTVLASRTGQV